MKNPAWFFAGEVLLTGLLRFALRSPFPFILFSTLIVFQALLLLAALHALRNRPLARIFFWMPFSAFLLRAILFTSEPVLSNDVYRYVWDGRLVTMGINPWDRSPTELRSHPALREALFPPDHGEIPSIYPPLAQAYFGAATFISTSPWIFALFASLADAVSVWLLLLALRKADAPLAWGLLFAWHPLSILESGHSGHLEGFGVLFLSLFLSWLPRHRLRASFALVAASLIKIWPAVFLTLLWREPKGRKAFLAGSSLVMALMVPFWFLARGTPEMPAYLTRWEFHGALYGILTMALPSLTARAFLATAFCSAALYLGAFRAPPWKLDGPTAGLFVTGAFLFLSPTVHPWYALWIIPFLVLRPQAEWIYLSFAVLSSYAVLPRYVEERVWIESTWPRLLTYAPVAIGCVFRFWKSARTVKTVT